VYYQVVLIPVLIVIYRHVTKDTVVSPPATLNLSQNTECRFPMTFHGFISSVPFLMVMVYEVGKSLASFYAQVLNVVIFSQYEPITLEPHATSPRRSCTHWLPFTGHYVERWFACPLYLISSENIMIVHM
jgi:hypothetical protein